MMSVTVSPPAPPFWMVWDPKGSRPKVQHPTRAAAVDEARRLAGVNPGVEFYVLEPVSVSKTTPCVVTRDFERTGCEHE